MDYHPIVIVEGPAGSGKSMLIKLLHQELHMTPIQRSLTSRDPTKWSGAAASWINDMGKLQEAMLNPRPAVDRLLWSQWVYGHLRRGEFRKKIGRTIEGTWGDFERLVLQTHTDLVNRLSFSGLETPPPPEFLLIFLLPPVDRLEDQRLRSGRTFPWAAQQEILLYTQIYQMLKCDGLLAKKVGWTESHYGKLLPVVSDFTRGIRR